MTEPPWHNVDPGESNASTKLGKESNVKHGVIDRNFESETYIDLNNPQILQVLPAKKVNRLHSVCVHEDRYYHKGELNLSGKHLSRSDISSLGYSFGHELKKLDLSDCGLTDTDLHGLENCQGLEELNLSNNSLHHCYFHGYWEHMSSLKKVDLSGCGVTHIDLHGLENYHGLEELNLSNNLLDHFDFHIYWKHMSSLKKLNLSDCGLTDIELHGLENCQGLEELNLSNNPLHHFYFHGDWKHMSSLKKLSLSGCGLTDIDLHRLENCHGLEELNLSNNPLHRLRLCRLNYISGVKRLDLSGCALTDKHLEDFKHWNRVEELNLSNNSLHDVLQYPRKLRKLNLSGCCLTKWPSGLEKSSSVQELNLSNNFFGHQDLLKNLNNRKMLNQLGLHKSEKELLEPAPSALGLFNLSRIIFEDAVYTKIDGG